MTTTHTHPRTRHCFIVALVAAAAVLAPARVQGQEDTTATDSRWQRLYEDELMSLWIDSLTVTRQSDGVLTVWTDWRSVSVRGTGDQRYDTMKSQDDVDCESRRHRPRRARFYLRGTLMGSIDHPPRALQWREPAPDSMGDTMVNSVCSWAGFP